MNVMGCVVSFVCGGELWELGRKGLIREGIVNGGGLGSLLRISVRLVVKELNWSCTKSEG